MVQASFEPQIRRCGIAALASMVACCGTCCKVGEPRATKIYFAARRRPACKLVTDESLPWLPAAEVSGARLSLHADNHQ
jgi:hypothetical protein